MEYLGILCYNHYCRLEVQYKPCLHRCPGASHRRVALERRKTSKLQAEVEGESGPGGTEQPGSLSPDADQGIVPAEQSFTSPALPAWTDEPSIDNPPFEENTVADSMSSLVFSSLFCQMWKYLWCQSLSVADREPASSISALFSCDSWRNISGFQFCCKYTTGIRSLLGRKEVSCSMCWISWCCIILYHHGAEVHVNLVVVLFLQWFGRSICSVKLQKLFSKMRFLFPCFPFPSCPDQQPSHTRRAVLLKWKGSWVTPASICTEQAVTSLASGILERKHWALLQRKVVLSPSFSSVFAIL